MSHLIVENGTGIADANGFITVGFADAYHAKRNNDQWVGPADDKEAAIIVATEHLNLSRFAYVGQPVEEGQALRWPRELVFDEETGEKFLETPLPIQLQNATAVIALSVIKGVSLYPDPGAKRVSRRRERSRSLEVETQFTGTASGPVLALAMEILRPLLTVGGNQRRLDRA